MYRKYMGNVIRYSTKCSSAKDPSESSRDENDNEPDCSSNKNSTDSDSNDSDSLTDEEQHTDPNNNIYNQNAHMENETTFYLINGIRVMNTVIQDTYEDTDCNQCMICLERRKIVAAIPCGHVVTCMRCAVDYHNNDQNVVCIVCSNEIDTLIGLYL